MGSWIIRTVFEMPAADNELLELAELYLPVREFREIRIGHTD